MNTRQITPTQLRKDLFKVLDRVAETGVPMEIRRGNVVLKIQRKDSVSRIDRIKPLDDLIVGDPDTILDSGQTWDEGKGL